MHDAVLIAGAIGVGLAAAASLALRSPRGRAVAMILTLVLAVVLVGIDSWDDPRIQDLRDSPATIAGGVGLMAAIVVALTALIRRWPVLLPLLAVAALPFRIPIEVDGEGANLLIPLYLVIAAGVAAAALAAFAGRDDPEGAGEDEPAAGFPALAARWLPWVLGGSVVLYAIQASYSPDLSQAVENLCFFYGPFAVLFVLLLTTRWTPWLLTGVLVVVLVQAILFAAVGFTEYAVRELLWNPQVELANDFHPYFRVNSLFWDPNILARYVAISAVAAVAFMLWTRSARLAIAAAAAALVMLATIGLTFSQSGLFALLAGLGTLAALRWSARLVLGGLATVAVVGISLALARGASVDLSLDSRTLQETGRAELIRGGLDLAGDRPIAGWGSGSFSTRFKRRFEGELDLVATEEAAATASHTEPVTIAAEQGAIGVLAYLALVVTSLAALLAGLGPLAPGLRGFRPASTRGPPLDPPTRVALAIVRVSVLAGLVAMLFHSLSYAAFLTDPITWTLLALGLALVRTPLALDRPGPGEHQPTAVPADA
jgi:putative inorganic carbon (HCO3(-)) transporter